MDTVRVPRLLVVHHTTSPTLQSLLDAVRAGATDPEVTGVDVVVRPALIASPHEALDADGYLLGTPANIGYMSGALKHFFDQIYYPCLDATVGRPFGVWVHGNSDTTGAIRGIETITTGLKWRAAAEPVSVIGDADQQARDACWNLGATLAATVLGL
jgi:hypothetical protein